MPADCIIVLRSGESEFTARGYIAYAIRQGEEYDPRCVAADMADYWQAFCKRKDAQYGLAEEVGWWLDFDEWSGRVDYPNRILWLTAGRSYILWRMNQLFVSPPPSDAPTCQIILLHPSMDPLLKKDDALYAMGDTPQLLAHGFLAALVAYAAQQSVVRLLNDEEPYCIQVQMLALQHWLEQPREVELQYVEFMLDDVRALLSPYAEWDRQQWLMAQKAQHLTKLPYNGSWARALVQAIRTEQSAMLAALQPYLSPKQCADLTSCLGEWTRYAEGLLPHKHISSAGTIDDYLSAHLLREDKQLILRDWKTKMQHSRQPAAVLAHEVALLQHKHLLKDNLRPLTRFVAAVNAALRTDVKADSFARHFSKNR